MGAVDDRGEAFKAEVAGDTAGHRLEPEPEARGDGRAAAVAAGSREEHSGGTERAGEIVRGEAGDGVERGQAEVGADARGEPRVGARVGGPDAFVEPGEDHHVGLLEAGFEEAEDLDALVTAIGRADRALVEQLAQQRNGIRGGGEGGRGGGGGFELGEEFAGEAAGGSGPSGVSGKRGGGFAQAGGEDGEGDGAVEEHVERGDIGAQGRPGLLPFVFFGAMTVEPGEAGGRARAAQREVERPDPVEPGKALVSRTADQRMLKEREQRDRGQTLDGGG